ncbi:MAG: hypothetical protein K940chlam7_00959 [Chlamydiae bacterium]|nr:hypothetical protein [Chlamydiota bacterium]
MGQKGEHTWDIVIHYHRCPECGYIIESRQGFTFRAGKYQKEVVCDRCDHEFLVVFVGASNATKRNKI